MRLGYNYRAGGYDNLFVNHSAAFYVQNIETQTLILHVTKDISTDVSNSREMYRNFAQVVYRLILSYPRAGHGIENEPNQYLDTIHRAGGGLKCIYNGNIFDSLPSIYNRQRHALLINMTKTNRYTKLVG